MMENKDFIAILVTVDLGILAAALAILTIFPAAMAMFDRGTGVSHMIDKNKQRRSILWWLAIAAFFAFAGLLAVLVPVLFFIVPVRAKETQLLCCMPSGGTMIFIKIWIERFAAACTGLSVLASGRAGLAIFLLTKRMA